MRACQCDRCGKNIKLVELIRDVAVVYGDDKFDLCPACYQKLEEFMGNTWKLLRGFEEDKSEITQFLSDMPYLGVFRLVRTKNPKKAR